MIKSLLGLVCSSWRRLGLLILGNLLLICLLFTIFEDGVNYFDSLYWAVTTASTTGYGDISPATTAGRLAGMWLMISSVIFVAMATAKLAAEIIQDPHIFSHEEQEEIKDDTDDLLTLTVLIATELGIPIPDSIEERDNILNSREN